MKINFLCSEKDTHFTGPAPASPGAPKICKVRLVSTLDPGQESGVITLDISNMEVSSQYEVGRIYCVEITPKNG